MPRGSRPPADGPPIVFPGNAANVTPRPGVIMIYELRVYRCIPNRLPALLKRFDGATLALFEKHGIRQAGFWTTMIGESHNNLFYLLAWESLAEREQKWAAF